MRIARLHDWSDVQRLLNHAVHLRHDETISSWIGGRSSLGSGYHVADAGRFVLPVSVTRVLCANTRRQTSVSAFKKCYCNVNVEWQIKKQVTISVDIRFSIWRANIIVKRNKNDSHFPPATSNTTYGVHYYVGLEYCVPIRLGIVIL